MNARTRARRRARLRRWLDAIVFDGLSMRAPTTFGVWPDTRRNRKRLFRQLRRRTVSRATTVARHFVPIPMPVPDRDRELAGRLGFQVIRPKLSLPTGAV